MLSLLAAFALHQQPSERLRTILPNGAAVLVVRMPKAKSLTVELIGSSKYTPETKATHGYRHLLEHLLARGENHDIDHLLESEGAFLTARTQRDAMQFEISLPPGDLDMGLAVVGQFLQPPLITQADIDKEVPVLEQELALPDETGALTAAAWTQAFGEAGLDPQGDIPTIKTATPEKILDVYAKEFAPSSIALVIVGNVDLDVATKAAKEVLAPLPADHYALAKPRQGARAGRADAAGFGEARAAIGGPFGGSTNTANIAVALALASEIPGCFVSYTPSEEYGLVTLGRTDQSSGVGLYIDGLSQQDAAALFDRGRILADRWLHLQTEGTDANAYLRGVLMSQRRAASPDDFAESLAALDLNGFMAAFARFRKDKAIIAVGQ